MNIQGGCLSTRVLPDRGRQLEQRRECGAVERLLLLRGVVLGHGHRCAPGEGVMCFDPRVMMWRAKARLLKAKPPRAGGRRTVARPA